VIYIKTASERDLQFFDCGQIRKNALRNSYQRPGWSGAQRSRIFFSSFRRCYTSSFSRGEVYTEIGASPKKTEPNRSLIKSLNGFGDFSSAHGHLGGTLLKLVGLTQLMKNQIAHSRFGCHAVRPARRYQSRSRGSPFANSTTCTSVNITNSPSDTNTIRFKFSINYY
jgi:hypothetical protein